MQGKDKFLINFDHGFPVIEYMSYLQSPGTQGQNMRPNRLSHRILKSSINTVVFVNATNDFSENFFQFLMYLDEHS